MIVLIESCDAKRENVFISLLHRLKRYSYFRLSQEEVLGMQVLRMSIMLPETFSSRKAERIKCRAQMILDKCRADTVIFKDGFRYDHWFDRYRRSNGDELVRWIIGRITLMAVNKRDRLYIYASDVDRVCSDVIDELCRAFRYVMLDGVSGNAIRKAVEIAERSGISIIINPTQLRAAKADAAVFLNKPSEKMCFDKNCVVTAVNNEYYSMIDCTRRIEEAEYSIAGRAIDIPDGFSQKALIFAALRHGMIRFEDIEIQRIRISP